MDDDSFPKRLEKAAHHALVNYTPTELGKRFKIRKQTVHQWMQGKSLPRSDTVFEIADNLGVDARWLAIGQGGMLPAQQQPQRKAVTHADFVSRTPRKIVKTTSKKGRKPL